jgi:hypothetical protein
LYISKLCKYVFLYDTVFYTVLEISIGYYFIISQPTRFLSLKVRKKVPNNGQSVAEYTTSIARHFLPVHLVHLVRFGMLWYVVIRCGTWLYVWYVLVRFGTSACRVGFFDMKLSLEGNWKIMQIIIRIVSRDQREYSASDSVSFRIAAPGM